jgi:predicted RNA-binding protein with PIN domain
MTTIIDGYNFLHALGRLNAQSGKTALEGARNWLLLQLRQRPSIASDVIVVFDALAKVVGSRRTIEEGGIRFLFSHKETADDLIETLIKQQPNPKQVQVVSDDRRLQVAGRREGCRVFGCLDFYEAHLELPSSQADRRNSSAVSEPEKPSSLSPEELQEWLRAFGETEDEG